MQRLLLSFFLIFFPCLHANSGLTFSYTEQELRPIREATFPYKKMTLSSLEKLTKETAEIVREAKLKEVEETILPGYMTQAQKEFALLSKQLTGELSGDLTPITESTLRLFIPKAHLPSVKKRRIDDFSKKLSALVLSKVKQRLKADRKQIHNYPVKKGDQYWQPTKAGYVGIADGSVKTWYLTSSDQFMATPPPQDPAFWAKQCEEIKEAQEHLTPEMKNAIHKWNTSTNGRWTTLLDTYLNKQKIPLLQRLIARAEFCCSLIDSNACCFNSKYTYFVRRPVQQCSGIQIIIPTPNHPSYPSAHTTISTAAALVLTSLFPENKDNWEAIAKEAGLCRIWGGIHYPVDHSAGQELGTKIGHAIVQKISSTE